MEVEIEKIKEEVKAIVSKIKNNIEKREEYGEKNTIQIESVDEEIFLGFDRWWNSCSERLSGGYDKNSIDDQHGDEEG